MRKAGGTHREIRKELGISLGTACLWTKDIVITAEQKKDIERRRNLNAFPAERRQRLRESALANLALYREKYTPEILIEKIRSFHAEQGRIPLKREFNMYNEFKRHFGSWNGAVRAAGFSVNPVLFAKKFIAKDGHKCDSFTEKIIDDWLFRRGITHERNKPYTGTKFTGDFFIAPRTTVEFFGLAGVQKSYDAIIQRKRDIAKKLQLELIEIYPRDVFEDKRLPELLRFD